MKTAPSGVTSISMGSVGDYNGYCIRGCTKIKRLCLISFSIVSLIGVVTLYAQHFDKRVHIEQFRLLDLSSFRGVAKGPVNFGELSNSSITARLRNATVEPESKEHAF